MSSGSARAAFSHSLTNSLETTTTSGRKRTFSDNQDEQEESNIIETATTTTSSSASSYFPIRKLRLEAVFYPKFENEHVHVKTIRKQMKQGIFGNKSSSGYLEVTLKHSGSLLLWSGGPNRFYSKNSTRNKFTAVGEVLLRQHFGRVAAAAAALHTATSIHPATTATTTALDEPTPPSIPTNNSSSDNNYALNDLKLSDDGMETTMMDHPDAFVEDDGANEDSATLSTSSPPPARRHNTISNADAAAAAALHAGTLLFQQCSAYVEHHRLTLSFEVVTSVLGDHGARPHRDFLILTAVANRTRAAANNTNHTTAAETTPNLFFSTAQLLEFAQRFRLPHNDCWVYCTESAVNAVFDLYDTMRETGTAQTVVHALTAACGASGNSAAVAAALQKEHNDDRKTEDDHSSEDVYGNDNTKNSFVQSMYPHSIFQGDILEGIVIRFVPCTNRNQEMRRMAQLSRQSRRILEQVPPNAPDCCQLMVPLSSITDIVSEARLVCDQAASSNETAREAETFLLSTNLRQLYANTKAAFTKNGLDAFEASLQTLVCSGNIQNAKTYSSFLPKRRDAPERLSNLHIWVDKLLHDAQSTVHEFDSETLQIAKLLKSLSAVGKEGKDVIYSVFREKQLEGNEDLNETKSRNICIVHVLHDDTFQKFHKTKKEGVLPLFRGCSFEIVGENESSDSSNSSINTSLLDSDTDICSVGAPTDPLMLKMKFLPYMVRHGFFSLSMVMATDSNHFLFSAFVHFRKIRTFICRNGLKKIRDGPGAFAEFYHGMLEKWGISQSGQEIWKPFFLRWGQYAQHQMANASIEMAVGFPPLSEVNYLDHLELAQLLYFAGRLFATNNGSEQSCRLQGLVVVVANELTSAHFVADYVAASVGGAKRLPVDGLSQPGLMDVACDEGGGCVYSTDISNKQSVLKNLAKKHGKFISIVLYDCSEESISALSLDANTTKARLGVLHSWRSIRCARVIELPGVGRLDSDGLNANDASVSADLTSLVTQLQQSVVADARPGLLVFFPTLPGSGKSTCVEVARALDRDAVSGRNLFVQEGDRTKESYWPFVKRIRQSDYGCVFVADKNTPFATWEAVGSICSSTKALAVPVVPDRKALQTTRIVGIRRMNCVEMDVTPHVYPFSLRYLAVCILRVIEREEGSHPGKLDASTAWAAMIVIKFYALYRSISSEDFLCALHSAFARSGALVSKSPIEVPFFKDSEMIIDLPEDLNDILVEAIQYQVRDLWK